MRGGRRREEEVRKAVRGRAWRRKGTLAVRHEILHGFAAQVRAGGFLLVSRFARTQVALVLNITHLTLREHDYNRPGEQLEVVVVVVVDTSEFARTMSARFRRAAETSRLRRQVSAAEFGRTSGHLTGANKLGRLARALWRARPR